MGDRTNDATVAIPNGTKARPVMGAWSAAVATASILVAAVSLTYALTTGGTMARLSKVEETVIELRVAKSETNAKLDNLILSVNKLEATMQKHIEAEK